MSGKDQSSNTVGMAVDIVAGDATNLEAKTTTPRATTTCATRKALLLCSIPMALLTVSSVVLYRSSSWFGY